MKSEKEKWEVMKLGGQYHTYDAIGKGYGAIRKTYFSICYRMLGDYFDAQDMTQETFLTYYRVLDRFDGQNEKLF